MKLPPRCKTTGKRCYPNELKAREAATRMWAKQPGEMIGDIHSFRCEACGYWHVGHWSKHKVPGGDKVEQIEA